MEGYTTPKEKEEKRRSCSDTKDRANCAFEPDHETDPDGRRNRCHTECCGMASLIFRAPSNCFLELLSLFASCFLFEIAVFGVYSKTEGG
jgi:hypothetical protein